MSAGLADWNPFSDDNFGEAAEDVMFGHEFDRLRRGSNSSKCNLPLNINLALSPILLLTFRFVVQLTTTAFLSVNVNHIL